MPEYSYTFKNSGDLIYNDVVYEHLFELQSSSYTFLIRPVETRFWRFGIRLSKTEVVEFYHPEHRYIDPNPDFPDIHLGVGEWDNVSWTFPNRLHLAQYYLEGDEHILNRQETYIEFGEVQWEIKYDQEAEILNISCVAEGCSPYSTSLKIKKQFKYFKAFAWADKTEFEIECLIKYDSNFSSSRTNRFSLFSKPKRNLFDSEKLVQIFKDLISESQASDEQFFALFGKWGRGKTYFWELLKTSLNKKDETQFVTIEFQAWKYQDTPAIWAYLYDVIAKCYNDRPKNWFNILGWGKYYWNLVALNKTRGNLKPILNLFFGVVLSILSLKVLEEFVDLSPVFNWLKAHRILSGLIITPITLYSILVYLSKNYSKDAKEILSNLIKKVSFESYLGIQHEIQKELVFLLKSWIKNPEQENKRILLFIDDIDRCSEEKIIQIVDYLRVLLHHPEIQKRMTVIAAIDERILLHAVKNKYKCFIEEDNPIYSTLCREYLDKLFIASLKLGALTTFEKKEIVDGFTEYFITQEEKIAESKPQEPRLVQSQVKPQATENKIVIASNSKEEVTNNIYFLEHWEQTYLENILTTIDVTPRSVRVFIIRYMFGKRLIEKPLKDNSEEYNIWFQTQETKKYFALQLLRFSLKEQLIDLEKAYTNFLSLSNTSRINEEEVSGEKFVINPVLNSIIYQVLTMIVAY